MNQQLQERKSILTEKLGVFFEKEHHLAPVAARIFVLIILSGKKGITFDELVCYLKAGKSTVSSHLENLQVHQKIEYFTITGDRKRYFKVNKNLMTNTLNELEQQWKEQRALFQEVLSFKKECMANDESNQDVFDIQFQTDFIAYADDVLQSIKRLKNKIK